MACDGAIDGMRSRDTDIKKSRTHNPLDSFVSINGGTVYTPG
jgi:hypothetical protein